MYPQRLRATAIALPHPDGRKQTSTFNDKDAQIGEKRRLGCKSRAHTNSYGLLAATNRRTCAPCTSTCPVGLEVRIQIPQLALAFLTTLDSRGPLPAKTNFVQPVPRGKSGYQHRERRQRKRPGFVPEKRPHDAEDVCRELAAAPVDAVYATAACPQPGEKFIHRSRPGHFRVGMSHTGDRVRVAAGNRDFSQPRPQPCGTLIGLRAHLPVPRF